jgi:hypothetical protein
MASLSDEATRSMYRTYPLKLHEVKTRKEKLHEINEQRKIRDRNHIIRLRRQITDIGVETSTSKKQKIEHELSLSSLTLNPGSENIYEKTIKSLKSDIEILTLKVSQLTQVIVSLTEQQIIFAEKMNFDLNGKSPNIDNFSYIN